MIYFELFVDVLFRRVLIVKIESGEFFSDLELKRVFEEDSWRI